MDYCPLCRRHLNGALVCAGCGSSATEAGERPARAPGPTGVHDVAPAEHTAYARQYAPPARPAVPFDDARPVAAYGGSPGAALIGPEHGTGPGAVLPAGAPPAHVDGPAAPGASAGPEAGGAWDADSGWETGGAPEAGGPGAESLDGTGGDGRRPPGGTRRTRPRRARSKRTRRIVTGALGLVLAGGVLSLAQLATDTPHGTGSGAGSVTDDSTSLDFDGAPGASTRPAVPGPPLHSAASRGAEAVDAGVTAPAVDPSGSPTAGPGASAHTTLPAGSPPAAPGGAGTAAGGGTDTTPAAGGQGGGGGEPAGGQGPPTVPTNPPASGQGGGGGTGQGATPDPTPTHCTRILFWCT